jgi:hypothetical protein
VWIGRFSGGVSLRSTPSRTIEPVSGRSKPGDHPQQRRLAAARGPEEGEEFPGSTLKLTCPDGREVAEAAGDVANLE